ncbi:GAF domain-containing sensor histidine kinase [Natronomonas sp. EA1]|uniref:GAF domain-containing sensor histidine kinase n=1 Tax=Natronomonas sp. EA1 TaxID=3421655 RepID=UPI003EB7BEC7
MEAIQRVVEVGVDYLDIDHGHVTNIDEADDHWEVIGSTDGVDGPYPLGLTASLQDSYCRRTIRRSSPLALHDAKAQGWADDHAYQRHQLDSYLGFRIDVFGEPYGTVCFVESDPRETPFSDAETTFIELAGHVLRKVLEETNREKDLANRDRLISVLNRVLRHNLRNDLNVVQGYAALIRERTDGEVARMSGTICSKSTELMDIAEKSRELEELTDTVPVARPEDVVPFVEEAVTAVRDDGPAVDISVDTPSEATAFAAPELSGAIEELLENATTHAESEAAVEVRTDPSADRVTVSVTDDGPGLPTREQRILSGETETALEHGSGLGLALVFWVVCNLDGEIEVATSARGTTVDVRLHRAVTASRGTGVRPQ